MKKRIAMILILCILFPFGALAQNTDAADNYYLGRWEIDYHGNRLWLDFYERYLLMRTPDISGSKALTIEYSVLDDGQIEMDLSGAPYTSAPVVISENEMQFEGLTAVRLFGSEPSFSVASNGEGTVEITGYEGAVDSLCVPEYIDGQAVTGIAGRAFAGSHFSIIELPPTLLYIGDGAFADSALKSLRLPERTAQIGANIVQGCANLEELYLPHALKWENIAAQDFSGCSDQLTVLLPDDTPLQSEWMRAYPQQNAEIYISYAGVWRGGNYEGEDVVLTLSEDGQAVMEIIYDSKVLFTYYSTWEAVDDGVMLYGEQDVHLEFRSDGLWGVDYSLGKDKKQVNQEPTRPPDENTSVFTYSLKEDGTAVITGIAEAVEIMVIPSYIDGYPVTEIGENAFEYKADKADSVQGAAMLREVVIPSGVQIIGWYAFANCSQLESVTLPETLTDLTLYSFSGCTSLETIALPESLRTIETGAFSGCTNLKQITLPQGLERLGEAAFSHCSSLESIIIPERIASLPAELFSQCTALSHVEMPQGLVYIGSSCFEGCTSLRAVQLPGALGSLQNSAFKGCTALESIDLPAGLTSLKAEAFAGCDLISQVTLPDSITDIGKDCFPKTTHIYFHDNAIVQLWAMGYGYSFTQQ